MKYCPVCLFSYPEEATACPNDGARLTVSFEWLAGVVIRNKYRILSKLGRGGAGTVYKAEHVALEELRALKVLNPQLGQNPQFVKRFLQEAKTTRRLHHPNIVRVEDLDQAEDGSLFISMEYIEGVTARRLLHVPDAPLPVARVLSIVRIVAEALHAAHEQGIVHRDIKPENILIGRGPDGRDVPKVVDFGLVALKEGSGTRSVEMMLTPAYAAPEQWRRVKGRELDGRTDVYALGVTLYQMLVGHRPFKGETFEELMHAHLVEVPAPPSAANPRVAEVEGLDALVLEMMAKDRESRPPSAAAVADRLDLLIADMVTARWTQGTVVITPPGTTLQQTFVAPFSAHQQSGQALTTSAEQTVPSAGLDATLANGSHAVRRLKSFAARPAVVAVLVLLALVGTVSVGLGVRRWIGARDGASPTGAAGGQAAPGSGETRAVPQGAPEPQAADSPKAPTAPANPREAPPGAPGAVPVAVVGLDAETVSKIGNELEKASRAHDLGDYDAAIAAYEAVLKLDQGNKQAQAGLARAQRARLAEGSIKAPEGE